MQLHRFDIAPEDISDAEVWEFSLTDGTSPDVRDLPDDAGLLTFVAGRALARGLQSIAQKAGDGITASLMHEPGSWPPVLELEDADDHHRHGLILAAPSSMEPRPTWPVTVPIEDLNAWEFDFIASCYVPKRSTLASPTDASGQPHQAIVVGWLWADEARGMPQVHAEPHDGHPFHAEYHQGRCDQVRALDSLTASLFAAAGADA